MTEARTEALIEALALAATVSLAALMLMGAPPRLNLVEAPKPREVALSLVEQPPPPPPAPPPPAAATPPAPIPPPPLASVPSALPPPLRHAAKPRHQAPPMIEPPAEAPPTPRTQADTAPAAPAEAPENHSAEAEFVGRVRAQIQRNTRPPDSAAYRLTHPSGEVDIGFALSRAGAVSRVHVLRSSGSPLIDDQGIAIVAKLDFPPMPADVYPGEASHAFSVPIDITWTGASDEL